jgi:hypothetical protein
MIHEIPLNVMDIETVGPPLIFWKECDRIIGWY